MNVATRNLNFHISFSYSLGPIMFADVDSASSVTRVDLRCQMTVGFALDALVLYNTDEVSGDTLAVTSEIHLSILSKEFVFVSFVQIS